MASTCWLQLFNEAIGPNDFRPFGILSCSTEVRKDLPVNLDLPNWVKS
jgi:hypothetical protein